MGATSGRSVLYGDVALIGVGVFVAVALVLAALGGPAAANAGHAGHAGAAHDAASTDGGETAPAASAAEDPVPSAPAPASGDAVATEDDPAHGGDADHAHGGAADAAPRREARPAPPSSSGTPPRPTATASTDHGDGGHQTRADDGGPHQHGDDDHAEGHTPGAGDNGDHAEGHDARGEEHGHGDGAHAEGHDTDAEGHDARGEEHEADEHAHGADEHDADDADGGHPTGSHGDHAAGCDENHPAAQQLLAEVQHSLDHIYPNVATMIAHGFIPYFDTIIPLGAATEGTGHWLNPDYIDNGVQLDATRPEGILTDQFHSPLGIMFIADAEGDPQPVYVDEDGTECSPWHPHTDTPATFAWFLYELVFDGKWMDGDVEWQPETPEMLHVWAVDNPYGVFAAHDFPEASDRPGLSLQRQLPLPPPAPFGEVLPTIDETVLGPISEQTCPHC